LALALRHALERPRRVRLGPVPHTLFRARLAAAAIDLRAKPFSRDAKAWTHRSDYGPTQAFAAVVRRTQVTAIRYQSVRDPQKGGCVAVLEPRALSARRPISYQTWFLTVTPTASAWQRDGETFEFRWT